MLKLADKGWARGCLANADINEKRLYNRQKYRFSLNSSLLFDNLCAILYFLKMNSFFHLPKSYSDKTGKPKLGGEGFANTDIS